MKLDRIEVGVLLTNCYILKKDNHALVIDPGADFEKIKNAINNLVIDGIIVTHYHFDHILALDELVNYSSSKVYDYTNLKEGINKINNFNFTCIYTPGHKEDLISIYFEEEKSLFCGDFIFKGTIGRCDFEGSSFDIMKESIKKALKLSDDTKIYPGHGEPTTIGKERDNLSYILTCK